MSWLAISLFGGPRIFAINMQVLIATRHATRYGPACMTYLTK